jgi:PAS domain S-box-containing protein
VTCWLKQTRWTLVGILLVGLVNHASALDPNRLPSQYVRGQWTTETGFPGGAVNAIAQTADGYLWVGADRGLLRFDGFNFKPVSFASIATPPNLPILQLLTDAGGKLWIRPQGAYLVRQKDREFESVRYGLPAITALSKDNHDGVLVSGIGQGTFHLTADRFQKLGPSSPPVISMAETDDGKVWLGTLGDGLFFVAGGQATNINAGLPDRKINSLLPIGEELWVGTDTGLYHGNGNGFRRLELPSFLGNVQVLSILRDHDSNIWVGTTRGLLRINANGISFSEENELRGDGGINVLFEDREGNLWIGGARGLGRIRDSVFVTFSTVNDRHFEHNGPVYVDPEGRTWLAPAQGGLYVLQNGRLQPVTSIPSNEVVYSINGRGDVVWVGRQRGGLTSVRLHNGAIASQSFTEANGLAQNSVYAVYESRDGSVWAGTLNGGVSKFKDGHFITYTTTNGLASNTVSSILETRDGAMWFATPGGVSSFLNGQWRTYTTAEGLPSPEVNCLFEDSSGTLWSETSAGLAFFASNHFQILHEAPEVLREPIVGMAEDGGGRFWIATSAHVLRVPRDKLLSGVVNAADIREFDQTDGLESSQGVKRSRSVVSDSAGRIWFSLSSGLSVVNPSQITEDSVPALPHIEAITADDYPVNLADSVRIPPVPRRITFEYSGLSLAAPGRIRFRYFLEGFDRSWSEPVAAREAVYTNLGPGSYRFRLVASNSEGLWNGPETAISFNVAPAFYQTTWFRALGVFLFLAVLTGIYRLRLRHLEHQRDALRKSEKELRDVIDTIPAMVWSTLPDGSNTYVNKRFVDYTGSSAEQTAGSGWQALIHPDDLELHAGKWMEAVATGKPHESEVRSRRADGKYRWQLDRGVPLRDENGNIVRWYGITTDIEDRKRAEEVLQLVSTDLQDNKAKLEEAQRIANVGYWEWDVLTGRVNWSDETYRIYGLTPQEYPIDIAVVRRMIHPEDLESVFRVAEEAVRGGLRTDTEHRIVRAGGEMRTVHSQGDLKRDASGQPYQMFGTVQDITDRKRAEEALQRSQFYISEGQRLAHMGSWAFNHTGFFEYWSPELFKIHGLDPQQGAPTVKQYLASVHPQDRDFIANTIKRMFAERVGCDVKERIVRPDGELRYIRCVGIPVVEGDVLKGFLGTAIDITEQELLNQELERRQAHLAEAQKLTHTGSWGWLLADRKPMHLSEEWYRIYGFDPAEGAPTQEEYLGRVHPEDRLKRKEADELASVEKADYDHEFRILLPNGKVKWIHTVGHPILSEAGDLLGFVGSSTDITALKSAEQEREKLRQLEADMAHIDRVSTLGEMAASLAHEIKQPIAAAITSANSCIEWLAHEPPNLDRARAAAARIDKYGNRAAEIIDRIRSFYRKSPPQRELVDVNGIIEEMLTLLKGEADRFLVTTRTELSADLPKIMVDRVQLQQVFMNLMLNAIEAMNASGGELTVKSERQDGQLQFSVRDTGVGLPTEKMDQIFSAFFTTKPQGSGMGLAISRSIVESHGGQLWASSNGGGGATFHFTLPTEVP